MVGVQFDYKYVEERLVRELDLPAVSAITFECRCSLLKTVCAHCYGGFTCYPVCGLYWTDRKKRSGCNICYCNHSKGNWCHLCRVCIIAELSSETGYIGPCLKNEYRPYCHIFCQLCQRIHGSYCPKTGLPEFLNPNFINS